jgi:imidazolonepropionase-like amidohydrolase
VTRLHTILAVAATCAAVTPVAAAQTRPIGITHVTVIDVERGTRLRDQTIVIEGNRIATVGPSSQVRVPDGYGVVDARGKFVTPGLIDTHAHLTSGAAGGVSADSAARWLVRSALSGVTTVGEVADRLPLDGVIAGRVGGAPAARLHRVESSGSPTATPGVLAADELRQAVAGGVSPAQALRAMTFDAARSLGLRDRVGLVAPGRLADLVVLDASPLDDIGNVAKIVALVLDGRFIDAAERNRLLERSN